MHPFRSVTLLILVVFLASVPCFSQLPNEQVDAVFSEWDRTSSPGCALGVIRDGELIYERGYGMADNLPVLRNSDILLMSIRVVDQAVEQPHVRQHPAPGFAIGWKPPGFEPFGLRHLAVDPRLHRSATPIVGAFQRSRDHSKADQAIDFVRRDLGPKTVLEIQLHGVSDPGQALPQDVDGFEHPVTNVTGEIERGFLRARDAFPDIHQFDYFGFGKEVFDFRSLKIRDLLSCPNVHGTEKNEEQSEDFQVSSTQAEISIRSGQYPPIFGNDFHSFV